MALSPIKLAIVGLGQVSQHQLAALAVSDGFTLVDACDTNAEQSCVLPRHVAFHSSLDDLIACSSADLYVVATPTATHYEIAKHLLEAGCDVVVEKPCAANEQQFLELVDLAAEAHRFFYVAFHAAYANDLLWFLDEMRSGGLALGRLSFFHAEFYDPYIAAGKLLSPAHSLGGSWIDSGINALSVIGSLIPPEDLRIERARMTVVDTIPCSQIQGTGYFVCTVQGATTRGVIDTNWTLGLNHKATRLHFDSGAMVLLDHSHERTEVRHPNGDVDRRTFVTTYPRLTNHYVNLFRNVADKYRRAASNVQFALPLHRLLFEALEIGRTV